MPSPLPGGVTLGGWCHIPGGFPAEVMAAAGFDWSLVDRQHGLIGDMKAPVDMTYLADTVLLLRFFEAQGRMLRALSVVKKRTGAHEDTIREFRIDTHGIRVGAPLVEFTGVLTGNPKYRGERDPLMEDRG